VDFSSLGEDYQLKGTSKYATHIAPLGLCVILEDRQLLIVQISQRGHKLHSKFPNPNGWCACLGGLSTMAVTTLGQFQPQWFGALKTS
jgi:hypothetical protein